MTANCSLKQWVRELSVRFLSQQAHARVAHAYNKVAARFVERRFRKPSDGRLFFSLPLVYISQSPRSGGTFLRNVFDGHRQCLVAPHELSWDKKGFAWDASLEGLVWAEAYERLCDPWLDHAIVNGLDKRHPFAFNRSLQKAYFRRFAAAAPAHERRYADCYLSSLFNAWMDYQNLYGPQKKYFVAFCPGHRRNTEHADRFFAFYPDGYRIHCVRDPLNWWASEKHYGANAKRPEDYLSLWADTVRSGMECVRKHPERYVLVCFEKILLDMEGFVRRICARLGLEADPIMFTPTINNMPRRANTSFGKGKTGVDTTAVDRGRQCLDPGEQEHILELAGDLYEQAAAMSL